MTPVIVFDIETFPISGDPNLPDELLEHKISSYEGPQKEQMRQKYQFLNPAYARVLSIGTLYVKDENTAPYEYAFYDDEASMLASFSQYLSDFRGLFVHFNGLEFDVPFLLARMAVHGIQPPSVPFCNLTRFQTKPHYDIMQVLCFWRSFGISLREACRMFGIPDPKEILGGKPVEEFLRTATAEEIQQYALGDARAEYSIFTKLYPIIS